MGILDKITKKRAVADKKEVKQAEGSGKREASKKKPTTKKVDKKLVAKKTDQKAESKQDDKKDEKKKGIAKKATTALFAYDIIREPVLTEKSDRGQANGKYTFFVSRSANKVEIARAIRELYGVKPAAVRILNVKGKAVRFGRLQGTRKNRKKAVITLKQGDIISVTE